MVSSFSSPVSRWHSPSCLLICLTETAVSANCRVKLGASGSSSSNSPSLAVSLSSSMIAPSLSLLNASATSFVLTLSLRLAELGDPLLPLASRLTKSLNEWSRWEWTKHGLAKVDE